MRIESGDAMRPHVALSKAAHLSARLYSLVSALEFNDATHMSSVSMYGEGVPIPHEDARRYFMKEVDRLRSELRDMGFERWAG